MYEFFMVLSGVEFVAIVSLVAYVLYLKIESEPDEDELANVEKLKLYSTYDFDKIDDRIDKYIDDAGSNYKLDNFEYKDPEDVYLTEDIMNDMIKAICKDVRRRITPAILSLLRLSYNITDEDDLIEFLYQRIRIYVLRYSLETNQDVQD